MFLTSMRLTLINLSSRKVKGMRLTLINLSSRKVKGMNVKLIKFFSYLKISYATQLCLKMW